MKILAVSSDRDVLAALGGILEALFDDDAVVCMADPLMAGKYAFHNRVDILLAQAEMKRMDGRQLIRFVRQEQPGVRAYLLGSPQERLPALAEGAAGCIPYPLSEAAVAARLLPERGAAAGEKGERV